MKNYFSSKPWLKDAYEQVKVIDLHLNIPPDKDLETYLFRIEILKSILELDKYYIYVLRADSFRLQATHPQQEGVPQEEPSDESIWVEDYFFWTDANEIYASDLDTVIQQAIKVFASRLKHCGLIDND